nr:MAG TPA: hypothetical protein [Bacteriophage sp.]
MFMIIVPFPSIAAAGKILELLFYFVHSSFY